MGTFRQVANAMYPFFLAGPDADIPHAHNLFLQVAVDLGLPGLIAWLAIFLLVCVGAWRVYRRGRRGAYPASPPLPLSPSPPLYIAGLGAGLLASQIALAVHGLTDAATWGTRPALIVWAVWGLAMAAWNLQRTADRIGRRRLGLGSPTLHHMDS
jgi:putative inorganic carbon (hco3(-)) transporter